MGQEQRQLIGTGATDDADDLVRRVRRESPNARELDKIAAAHAVHSGVRHRLWLDEKAGVLLFLERAPSGNRAGGGAELHQIALRSVSCTTVLADLTATVLARLAGPADSYHARPEVDRDIGALVQLFRVQLARMRTEHPDRAELVQEIHAQIGRAGDEQQAARRKAFLGWYLEHTYGNDADAHEQAAQDLGCDFEESINTHLDDEFVADTIMDWGWYRRAIRSHVLPPMLDGVPSDSGLRRGDRHWYYEFRALGRQLTEQQRLELCAELPQADVTSDSLVLDQWSDLTEHPIFTLGDKVISRYFDAGLHFHQSGSRTLWLRLPAALAHQIAPYEDDHGFAVETTIVGDDLVLRLQRHAEDGESSYLYDDPRPWLEELLPLRVDLTGGDLRALAIARRAASETLALFTKTSKPDRPPMPDHLDEDELNPQLNALIRLLEEVP